MLFPTRGFRTHRNRATHKTRHGWTLLEILIVLAITGILAGYANPSFTRFIGKNRADSLQALLRSAIYTARSEAISTRTITILCPLADGQCGSDWSKGLMVFSDRNNNQSIDAEDTLVAVTQFGNRQMQINWKASAGRNYLRYSPSGMAREMGRFHLCARNNDRTLARSIVVNRNGRLRLYRDRDRDGIVEDIDGRQPQCS